MGLIVGQARASDLLETVDDFGRRQRFTRRGFALAARQAAEGAALTIRDEAGALVAVVGLWPEADHAEAWLAVGAGFRASPVAAVRRMRALLDAVGADVAPMDVRAFVRPGPEGRVAGARLAAWLGFETDGEDRTAGAPLVRFVRRFTAEGARA